MKSAKNICARAFCKSLENQNYPCYRRRFSFASHLLFSSQTMSKKKKNLASPTAKAPQPQPATAPTRSFLPNEKLLLAGCLMLTFIAFANTLSAGFVNWDDHGYLWLNPLVQPLGSADWGAIFSSHTHGNYSPLVVLSYCLEHTFDAVVRPGAMVVENFEPFRYHFDNVLLHLGTTALTFFFLRALGLSGWGLAFATALFGIHPMRVESVAWVTERKDVLYGLFYIAALLSYWQYLAGQKSKLYLLALLFGVLALFSKIQAVSLPLSMLALDWLAGRSLKNSKVWLEKLPFFALSLVFGLVGIHFLNEAEGLKETGYPLTDRFFFATASLVNYLWKCVAPFGLSAYYPYPKLGAMPPTYYAAPLALAVLAWWAWHSARHSKIITFGLLFFLVNIVFVLQFKGAGKAFMADRFTYIPYLGLFFIFGKTYCDIESGKIKTGLKSALPYLAAGFLALCAVLTFRQNTTWQSSVALWENVTAQHPNDALSWTNKGLAHFDAGEYEASARACEQALKVDPTYFDAAFNLGVAHNKMKRYADAATALSRAIEIKPDNGEAWFTRGQMYSNAGDFARAIPDYEKGMQLGLSDPLPKQQASLAAAYAGANQHARAVELYDLALRGQPDADYHFKKGNALAALGKMPEAIASYDAALALLPDFPDAANNRGNAFAAQGNFAAAIAAFDKAIELKPDAANFRFNRGMARHSMGDRPGACTDWQQASIGGYQQAQGVLQQFCK
jgi:tetratricopeptide (TPR) repeat protein